MKHLIYGVLIFINIFILSGCSDRYISDDLSDDTNNEVVVKSYEKDFSYDSTNKIIKEDLGNGTYIEYIYDDSGNLISQTVVE